MPDGAAGGRGGVYRAQYSEVDGRSVPVRGAAARRRAGWWRRRSGCREERWSLVYQSRSGRPQDPWLEPDILDHIQTLSEQGVKRLVIHPVGFLSDHMEVLYDLDEEAKMQCDELGMRMERAATVGISGVFVRTLAKLIKERVEGLSERPAMGQYGPSHDVCPVDCCLPPARPAVSGRPPVATS